MSGYAVGHVLRSSRFTGTSLLVLIVIAEATHQDGSGAWPSVASIAQLARTTDRSVRRVLSALEKAGELLIERNAGPRGTNLYTVPGIGQVRLGEDAGVTPDKLSGGHRKRRPRTTAASTPDNSDPTPDTAVSAEPSLEPVVDPSVEPSRASARAKATDVEIPTRPQSPAEIEKEQKAFRKEAETVWLETVTPLGSIYTDTVALKVAGQHALMALRFGTPGQILAAIRARALRETTPRRIAELTRLYVGDELQRSAIASQRAEMRDEVIEGPRLTSGGLRPIAAAARAVVAAVAS